MKQLIALFLIFSQTAQAISPPTFLKGQADAVNKPKSSFQVPNNTATDLGGVNALIETGYKNFLLNPSFEHLTYSTSWTIANSTPSLETTQVTDGKKSALLTLSAQTGDLITQNVTPTVKLEGSNLEASCKVKTTLTTIQVCSLQGGNEMQCVSVPSTGVFQKIQLNMAGPSSGSIGVKVKATSSSTGTVTVDECYVGAATNIGSIQQAVDFGSATYLGASSCIWTHAATTTFPTSYTANASCSTPTVTGSASAPATKIPAITFATMGAGTYIFHASGAFMTETNRSCTFTFYDGTTTYPAGVIVGGNSGNTTYSGQTGSGNFISARIKYTSPQVNKTIEVQGIGENASSTCQLYADATPRKDFNIWVEYFPSLDQQAVSSAQADYEWSTCSITIGAVTTPPTLGTNTTTCKQRRVDDSMEIMYTLSQTSAGTAGSGIYLFPIPNGLSIDTNKVTVTTTGSASGGTPLGTDYYSLGTASGSQGWTGTVTAYNSTNLRLNWNVNATSYQFFGQGASIDMASTPLYVSFTAKVPIQGWTSNQRAPTLVGSITSDSSTSLRMEAADITCVTGPTINRQTAPNFLASITRTGTGQCPVVFSKSYTTTPYCFCSVTATANVTCSITSTTTTGFTTSIYLAGSSLRDDNILVSCIGTR